MADHSLLDRLCDAIRMHEERGDKRPEWVYLTPDEIHQVCAEAVDLWGIIEYHSDKPMRILGMEIIPLIKEDTYERNPV